MTKRPDASSSDLERARTLGRRLRPEGLLPSARPLPDAPAHPAYIRFEIATPAPTTPPIRERLARCLDLTHARAIAVFGTDGRSVGVFGEWTSLPATRLEAVGARLAVALDQAERLEGRWEGPRSLGIAIGPDWIAGLRIVARAARLTVGLLVDRPLGREALAAVTRELDPGLA